MKITIIKKAETKKNAAAVASCTFIIEDMLPGRK